MSTKAGTARTTRRRLQAVDARDDERGSSDTSPSLSAALPRLAAALDEAAEHEGWGRPPALVRIMAWPSKPLTEGFDLGVRPLDSEMSVVEALAGFTAPPNGWPSGSSPKATPATSTIPGPSSAACAVCTSSIAQAPAAARCDCRARRPRSSRAATSTSRAAASTTRAAARSVCRRRHPSTPAPSCGRSCGSNAPRTPRVHAAVDASSVARGRRTAPGGGARRRGRSHVRGTGGAAARPARRAARPGAQLAGAAHGVRRR